jgi:hypothetical protein
MRIMVFIVVLNYTVRLFNFPPLFIHFRPEIPAYLEITRRTLLDTSTTVRLIMFAAIIASLLTSAVAFAPSRMASKVSSLKMGFENELGAQAPLGFWDPLGLLKNADQDRFDRLRYVEVKHGRITMLAILGHIVTTKGDRLPGNIAFGLPFADMKAGLGAFETIPFGGLVQLFFFIGVLELGFGSIQTDIEEDCIKRMEQFGWDKATQVSTLMQLKDITSLT